MSNASEKTYTIEYINHGQKVEGMAGASILATSIKSKIEHTMVCGGNARCSSCRVFIRRGLEVCSPRNEHEELVAKRLGFPDEVRLACQTIPSGNISIYKPPIDDTEIAIASLTIAERTDHKIGEERTLSVLFADIEGYTTFTEAVEAYDLVFVLNRYYYIMGKIIKKHDGRIIDYYGDGLLAAFGFEDPDKMEHNAIKVGELMFEELKSFNKWLYRYLRHKFKIRIGISTGKVIVGNIGFKTMRKLAVIGNAVNFASRIDSANKDLGTHFLVSKETYEKVKDDFEFGDSHLVEVKGKSGTHELYELKK